MVALYKTYSTRSGMSRWACKCDCGQISTCATKHLLAGNTKSCGCLRLLRGSANLLWSGYGEMSGDFWNSIVTHSLSRTKVPIRITKKYAWNLFLEQDRKCALTGFPLIFSMLNQGERTASLDRIDSSKGYIKGNVQWVHKDVNRMKNVFTQEYFIHVCKNIAKFKGEQNGFK